MAELFDRTLYSETNGRDLHRTMDETLEENCVYAIHAISWEGDYDACKRMYDYYYCNQNVSSDDPFVLPNWAGFEMVKVITNKSLRHKVAGRGTVTFTIKCYNKGYEGNIDFERVDRDIHCWRALCSTEKPILSQVKLWERNLEIDRPDLWEALKYVGESGDVVEITDPPTRTLCGMIMRGVESYPEYYPVLNVTITFAKHPCALGVTVDGSEFKAGALLGKVVTQNGILPDEYFIPLGDTSANPSPETDFIQLEGEHILCTADKLQMNGDGSYTLNRAFMKCRQIEPEIYIGAPGAEFTPYDEPNTDS